MTVPTLSRVELVSHTPLASQPELSPEDLAKISRFTCGSEQDKPWEQWINRWITNVDAHGVDNALARGTDVWLYWDENDEFVGFSSLCHANWPWPGATDPEARINLIPAIGVDIRFQHKPEGVQRSERYSWQILGDVIQIVKNPPPRKRKRIPALGLYVDVENQKAIEFYKKAGFTNTYRTPDFDGRLHQGMVLDLSL